MGVIQFANINTFNQTEIFLETVVETIGVINKRFINAYSPKSFPLPDFAFILSM